ncbi:DUF885 family protein [Sphingomonas aerolata]|uniref:DUF885 family protein n=1 Tax=Sphingomonas aerolata TaxID=185951 RepID=UPI002FE34851
MFPASIPAADRTRLTAAYAKQVREVINPAHVRMRDFLANEYLAKARDTVRLSALPGGAALYAQRIEDSTTLPLEPEAVHQLGLSEVARITQAMEAQKAAVGFKGTLAAFFDYLRTDPRFQPKSAAAVREGYEAIGKRVNARIATQFSLVPKVRSRSARCPISGRRPMRRGQYQQGTPTARGGDLLL